MIESGALFLIGPKGLRDGSYVSIGEKVIRPSAEEKRDNPRSSAAKLRFAVRG